MATKTTVKPETENTAVAAEKAAVTSVDLDIKVPVFLPYDDNKSENDQFEVASVNGKNYQIQRGVQVSVPYRVFEALYNSGRFKRL